MGVITRSTPVLACSDILAALAFYKDVLGFETSWTWGEPPTFAGASWGAVDLMFCLDPELASHVEGHQLWIDADDVDAVYSRHVERGAPIVSPIENKPWNRREYTVRDPNGYHLRIGGQPSHQSKGTGVFPEGVRIEARLPTYDEYFLVTRAAFGAEGGGPEVLERSWAGVVALGPDGEAIGVLRVMYDAPGWFSVWDVGVRPQWQGQRIGSVMMEKAVDLVRSESPRARVYLFTFKGRFYERLGFEKQSLHVRRV